MHAFSFGLVKYHHTPLAGCLGSLKEEDFTCRPPAAAISNVKYPIKCIASMVTLFDSAHGSRDADPVCDVR